MGGLPILCKRTWWFNGVGFGNGGPRRWFGSWRSVGSAARSTRPSSARRKSESVASSVHEGAGAPDSGFGPGPEVGERGDCRICPLRARCISYGWMSPGGIWFENAVVLRPTPGCRGYEGRGADIFRHFETSAGDDER